MGDWKLTRDDREFVEDTLAFYRVAKQTLEYGNVRSISFVQMQRSIGKGDPTTAQASRNEQLRRHIEAVDNFLKELEPIELEIIRRKFLTTDHIPTDTEVMKSLEIDGIELSRSRYAKHKEMALHDLKCHLKYRQTG